MCVAPLQACSSAARETIQVVQDHGIDTCPIMIRPLPSSALILIVSGTVSLQTTYLEHLLNDDKLFFFFFFLHKEKGAKS